MPPSHRSHSSHSRSHSSHSSHRSHSSSHSHSSHRSHTSSRTKFGSHSSSHSTHRTAGSSFGSSHATSRAHRRRHRSTMHYRSRSHQPTGYTQRTAGFRPTRTHVCRNHDYVFYPISWFDEVTGNSFRAGYYDENGEYYQNVIFRDEVDNTVSLTCEYCGTDIKTVWDEGAIPQCPNCGANLKEAFDNAQIDSIPAEEYEEEYYERRSPHKGFIVVFAFIMFAMLSQALLFFTSVGGLFFSQLNLFKSMTGSIKETEISESHLESHGFFGSEYFVPEIGRTLYWDEENESYYDSVSDCYLYYNTDDVPFIWQYWYEGISSDYLEYGWMEYVDSENLWYIEVAEDEWIVLPDEYDSSELWHTGPGNANNGSIMREMLGK